MTLEKAPTKKKIPKLKELKKPIIIGVTVSLIAITGIVTGVIVLKMIRKNEIVFVYGVYSCAYDIDPLAAFGPQDIQVINQVAEGLFEIDVKSDKSRIINNLAIDHTWSDDALNLTCFLRQGVKFHDDTPFNATAVKWNFDRLHRLLNNTNYPELWLFPDNQTIINQTQVLGEYTIRFILNAPYVPLESLLTSWTSFILSPTATPEDEFIDVLTGDLVGTGPFIYDSIVWEGIVPINVIMSANPYYWGGKPKIDKLIFSKIPYVPGDASHFDKGLSSGEIHLGGNMYFNESLLNKFKNNSSFTVHDGIPRTLVSWLIINNRLINATMRKAISYAFNYSSLIEVAPHLWKKPESPIPEGILYHNTTGINIPYCNISLARQILKDVNWSGIAGALLADDNVSAGNEWELVANSSFPLATYNYSWIIGWTGGHFYILDHLTEAFKQIGVKLERVNLTEAEWDYRAQEKYGYTRDMFEITYIAWVADYNDPSNYINSLFSNKKPNWNIGQVNDTQVQEWMEEGLEETNETAREEIYYQIQKRLIEEVYPNIWIWQWRRTDVYVSNLRGWYPNGFKDLFKFVYLVKA
ncbi:MAG: ABC transporter substrate-binding protein [Candidatus Thorarchaeota archaeon]